MKNSKRGKRKITNYYKFFASLVICILFIIIIGVLSFQFISNFSNSNQMASTSNNASSEPLVPEKQDITIQISAIGDAMCHSQNFKDAYNSSTGVYDFSHVFQNIASLTSSSDITIGNLETTFAGADRKYSGYPTFNTPSTFGNALKDIGVDILCTANNHSLDKSFTGLVSTLDSLDEIGLSHIGTYRSQEEQNTILVKDVNGIKIAFLAFTYGTNGIPVPSGKEYCINLIDKDLIKEQLDLAKAQNVDLICVNMHWGAEYQTKQNSTQEELADFLFANGVDIIFGSHPHVLQPMEKRTITLEDGSTKDGFVIYSLGNFVSGQVKENTKDTIVLTIQITKNKEDKISIDKVTYTPVYVNDKGTGKSQRFQLLDIRSSMADYEAGKGNINAATYNILKTRLEKIEKIVGPEIGIE